MTKLLKKTKMKKILLIWQRIIYNRLVVCQNGF